MCLIILSAIISNYIWFKIESQENLSLFDFCIVRSKSTKFGKMLFRIIILLLGTKRYISLL